MSKTYDVTEKLILGVDMFLKTIFNTQKARRPSPGVDLEEIELSEEDRRDIAGLMRVNHTGEVCAQALYDGQAFVAEKQEIRESLIKAAEEEQDHLAWCYERLDQLSAAPSVLNPFFYLSSFAVGALAGKFGDTLSLGFVEATEAQVVKHLEDHLDRIPEEDLKSRAILRQMVEDEAKHGDHAIEMGGQEFPEFVKKGMSLLSKIMTETTYRV
ncbi:MAG: demethoxyubiquinone hydroxylase family protein [Gammaproteobacteria bacterium]|nr:demethoxyubiquinone hydroxylase family protein [Gammaproteobacteria bacterium]